MNFDENYDETKSEFSELGEELIHVKKVPLKEENPTDIRDKTLDFGISFEPNSSCGDIKSKRTHQYLKFVNEFLVERLNLIEKMKMMKNTIEYEIELLESNDMSELTKITNIPTNEINQINTYMKLQQGLKNPKTKTHNEKSKNSKILFHKNQLEHNNSNQTSIENNSYSELDNLVKEELRFLIKKYGMKELTYAIDVITSSKMIRNNRYLE